MALFKSLQITNAEAVPAILGDPSEQGGRVRRKYFSFTVPAGNAAINDTVQLTRIPKGARLLGGKIAAEAMSTAGAVASIQIGDGTTPAKYLGTTGIDTAAISDFGDTVALNFAEKLAAELTLTATVLVEAWAAGQKLLGYIDFMTD